MKTRLPEAGKRDAAFFNEFGRGRLPEYLGFEIVEAGTRRVVVELAVAPRHLAPNGFLHGGTVVALADTAAAYASIVHVPEEAEGFTTLELKTNFLGTATEGRIVCVATPVHLGRLTHVVDAEVLVGGEGGKRMAVFRATQVILYPRG